ncbi:hypothetical protein A4D02_08160 [Niastella koreensis]|uniref:Uncharacterized protein n=1 Tax=Niastella koreensis TaxID=354356 RepID=A0ABX3NYK3_9BACT|nr:hypothetical protein A4D02_08160 [Niastella koreensis]
MNQRQDKFLPLRSLCLRQFQQPFWSITKGNLNVDNHAFFLAGSANHIPLLMQPPVNAPAAVSCCTIIQLRWFGYRVKNTEVAGRARIRHFNFLISGQFVLVL